VEILCLRVLCLINPHQSFLGPLPSELNIHYRKIVFPISLPLHSDPRNGWLCLCLTGGYVLDTATRSEGQNGAAN
jgi:hypothetical protein